MAQDPIVIDFDGSIVTVTFYGEATNDQYNAYLEHCGRILSGAPRVGIVFSVPKYVPTTSEQRLLQSRWLQRHREMLTRAVAGAAFHIPSPLSHVFLRAVFMFAPPPYPYTVTTSLDEARSYCAQQLLQRAG